MATAEADTAASINGKLRRGLHVVLCPGVYLLDDSLHINATGQVLFGLGLATLVSTSGAPSVVVGNVDGVRVAGVLLQAGAKPTPALLVWGDGTHAGSQAAPGGLHDVYARVGGPDKDAVQASSMIQVHSGWVIGDNVWLWRADHTAGGQIVKGGANPVDTGLEVTGDDVSFIGLAVEHTLGDLVRWSGERGATYFYQAELPYDGTNESYAVAGHVGYRVANAVTEHDAYGVGVYHYFRDHEVRVPAAIRCPTGLEHRFRSPLTVFLNGRGTIQHVLNVRGNATGPKGGPGDVAHWCGAK